MYEAFDSKKKTILHHHRVVILEIKISDFDDVTVIRAFPGGEHQQRLVNCSLVPKRRSKFLTQT
jgi:hypothetical protein